MHKLYFGVLLTCLMACNSNSTTSAEEQAEEPVVVDTVPVADTSITLSPVPERWQQKAAEGIDFIATGNEPFWSIEIDEEKFIRYTTPEGVELTTSPVKPDNIDAVTKLYKAETDSGKIELQVMNKMCINDMSGDSSAYTVHVSIQLKKDEKQRVLHGCGTSLKQ